MFVAGVAQFPIPAKDAMTNALLVTGGEIEMTTYNGKLYFELFFYLNTVK